MNMKKTILLILILFKFSIAESIETKAKQLLLFDVETNTIIFEKNADELMSPSSMSKIMTLYLLFKKIDEGEFSLEDEFEVSKKAWKKGGSRMFLNLYSKVKVEDLIRGIIVQSGNDACIVIAEGVSGSEEMFVEELNSLAKEIGLNNSHFKNSTGWPDPEHLMTSRDLLTLSLRTIKDYPEFYHYYAEKEFVYNKIKQLNRNPLLFSNSYADGLKTGHTSLGGYGLVSSVKKNDRRLILILNGLKTNISRKKESEKLIKLGFNQFKNINIADKNEMIKKTPVWGGTKKLLEMYSQEKISITVPKKIKKKNKLFIKYHSPLLAPIKKDQIVGEFIIKKENEILKKFNLYSREEIKKLNFFGKVAENLKYLLLGDTSFAK